MIIETKVVIVARLAEIGRELNRLKGLPLSEKYKLAKALRCERRKLMEELAAT